VEGWYQLSDDEIRFLDEVVDTCGGILSHNKWKKLYALLAELCNRTKKNYRVYRSLEGLLYDTTIHSVVTQAELTGETYHRDAEREALENVEVDKFYQLKRWKFEIDQLDIKIEQLTNKRNELQQMYIIEREQFMEGM
jgi:hypothetical protein